MYRVLILFDNCQWPFPIGWTAVLTSPFQRTPHARGGLTAVNYVQTIVVRCPLHSCYRAS